MPIVLAIVGFLACSRSDRCADDAVRVIVDSGPSISCGRAPGAPPGLGGPSTTRLRIATSPDGENWSRAGTLVDRADVPTCVTEGDTLAVMGVHEGADGDALVRWSTSDVHTWRQAAASVSGLPVAYRPPIDPAWVSAAPGGEPMLFVVSGRDTDASVFALEPHDAGRADPPQWRVAGNAPVWSSARLLDPVAVRLEDGTIELFAGGDPRTGHRHARLSPDGTLVELPPVAIADEKGRALKLANGVPGDAGVMWAHVRAPRVPADSAIHRVRRVGGAWTVDPTPALRVASGDLLAVKDPTVCPDPRGSGWVMVYATAMPP